MCSADFSADFSAEFFDGDSCKRLGYIHVNAAESAILEFQSCTTAPIQAMIPFSCSSSYVLEAFGFPVWLALGNYVDKCAIDDFVDGAPQFCHSYMLGRG